MERPTLAVIDHVATLNAWVIDRHTFVSKAALLLCALPVLSLYFEVSFFGLRELGFSVFRSIVFELSLVSPRLALLFKSTVVVVLALVFTMLVFGMFGVLKNLFRAIRSSLPSNSLPMRFYHLREFFFSPDFFFKKEIILGTPW